MPINMLDRERRRLVSAIRTGATAVGFLWILHALRIFLGMPVSRWGIVPRELGGLHGILTAPLAHGDWGHLANNSVPLLATIILLVYFFPRIAGKAMVQMYVLTGLAVWLLARGAGWGASIGISHVGASGVAYALVSFLFWLGVFQRSVQSIIVALVILLYFSGMIVGILPDQLNVSWESHLLGGIVGMLVAWAMRKEVVRDPGPEEVIEPAYQATPYFPADIFEYTRAEREEMRQAALEAERIRRANEEGLDEPPLTKLW